MAPFRDPTIMYLRDVDTSDEVRMPGAYRLGGYSEWRPPVDVAGVVEAVWTFDRPMCGPGTTRHTGHRVLPHNGPSLCFRSVRSEDGRPAEGRLVVMGPARTFRIFRPEPGCRIEAIRLHPEWMRSVLGIDGREHADVIETLGCGSPASRLRDRLAQAGGRAEILRLLLDHVRERIASERFEPTMVLAHAALERIRRSRSSVLGLAELGRKVGASERHLRRAVRRETGVSPKRLQRVERMNGAVTTSDLLERPDWSRIAVEHGYCDQAHLIREVRALAGRSPAELHTERMMQRG